MNLRDCVSSTVRRELSNAVSEQPIPFALVHGWSNWMFDATFNYWKFAANRRVLIVEFAIFGVDCGSDYIANY